MIQVISKEISDRKNELKTPLSSIYFGGGTPSVLHKQELGIILESVYKHISIDEDLEITLEANPENVSFQNATDWKDLGFNRLSIGLQSFKKEDLVWMNRNHTKDEGLSCLETVKKAGFKNISVDLMYGLPQLSSDEWLSFLEKVTSMDVQHLSAYCLTIEDKTKLKQDVKKGKIKLLPEQEQAEQFELLISYLTSQGYEQYEVSNFAKDKCYSKHNSSYWKGASFLGVGPSAHSFDGNKRRWNVANNKAYILGIKQEKEWYTEELLTDDAKWNELFLTGLRTMWGVSKKQIKSFGGFVSCEKAELLSFQNNGLITEKNNAFVLTDKGMLFADGISESFFRVS
jgi:oxygen-independent coproporphyrinogen-3 oxidase